MTSPAVAERQDISEGEWTATENLQKIFKPLQVATTVLCSDTHSPISMVRPIAYMLCESHLNEPDDGYTEITSMKKMDFPIRFEVRSGNRNKCAASCELPSPEVKGLGCRVVPSTR